MGKFIDILGIVETQADKLAEYHYTSIREFANITQNTVESKILFMLNSDNLNGTGEIPSRILSGFELDLWVVKNHKLEASNKDIAIIQDECFTIMNNFMFEMNKPNIGYFPLENWTYRFVRNTTPNAFAGVRFTLKIKTGCNLGN